MFGCHPDGKFSMYDRLSSDPSSSNETPLFRDAESPARELEPEHEELQDLLRRRRQLVEQRVRELGRVDKGVTPYVARSTRRHISWLEKDDPAYINRWTRGRIPECIIGKARNIPAVSLTSGSTSKRRTRNSPA